MSRAIVFPGQGSQYVGMGNDFLLAEDQTWFDEVCERVDFPLGQYIQEGPAGELSQTYVTQPAIFVVNHLVFRHLKRHGVEADVYAGHSLGEYNALVAAGMASFDELFPVVVERGRAMNEAAQQVRGGMAAVLKMEPEPLQELCQRITSDGDVEGTVEVALFNSPGQSVVSGSLEAIDAVVERARDAGALKAVQLDVSGPWHSQYMEPAQDSLRSVLKGVDWSVDRPVVVNVTADYLGEESPEATLVDQLVEPVRWVESVRRLLEDDTMEFIEVGPGKVLGGLVKRIARKTSVSPAIHGTDTLEQTEKLLEEEIHA